MIDIPVADRSKSARSRRMARPRLDDDSHPAQSI
jgi:hypothetical protein